MNQYQAPLRVYANPRRTFRPVWPDATLALFMGMRMRAVAALLLFGIASLPAVCQFARQGVLLSRPASVVLIARVESLSVNAAPVGALSALSSAVAPAAQSMSITSRWALPRNLTTLRLTVYRDASLSSRMIPGAAPRSGQTVLLQGSGDSNQETSRTDHLDIASGLNDSSPNNSSPNNMGRKLPGKDTEAGMTRLTLVVQAL